MGSFQKPFSNDLEFDGDDGRTWYGKLSNLIGNILPPGPMLRCNDFPILLHTATLPTKNQIAYREIKIPVISPNALVRISEF
jgi:hypothetical protein